MKELDEGLSEKTLAELTCSDHDVCKGEPKFIQTVPQDVTFLQSGPKLTTKQIQAERKQRSSTHFKKEVLPYLGKDEQIHHAQKGTKPI